MGERTLYRVVESRLCLCVHAYWASVAPLCMRWADGEGKRERERQTMKERERK